MEVRVIVSDVMNEMKNKILHWRRNGYTDKETLTKAWELKRMDAMNELNAEWYIEGRRNWKKDCYSCMRGKLNESDVMNELQHYIEVKEEMCSNDLEWMDVMQWKKQTIILQEIR